MEHQPSSSAHQADWIRRKPKSRTESQTYIRSKKVPKTKRQTNTIPSNRQTPCSKKGKFSSFLAWCESFFIPSDTSNLSLQEWSVGGFQCRDVEKERCVSDQQNSLNCYNSGTSVSKHNHTIKSEILDNPQTPDFPNSTVLATPQDVKANNLVQPQKNPIRKALQWSKTR